MKKNTPKFKSQARERSFWASHDSADYVDWKKGKKVPFPNLRPSLSVKAKELDRRFDAGEDISKYLDLSRAKRTNEAPKRVNVDFPAWMVHSLDKEAGRLGVTRQSIIKIWISERLSSKRA